MSRARTPRRHVATSRTATSTVPACTSRSRPRRRPTRSSRRTSAMWDAGHASRARHRRQPLATTTASASTAPASCAEALGTSARRAAGGQGRTRPHTASSTPASSASPRRSARSHGREHLDWNALARRRQRRRWCSPFRSRSRHRWSPTATAAPGAAVRASPRCVGFVLGAGVPPGHSGCELPLKHGLLCAVGTYVVAQAVFIVDPPHPRQRHPLVGRDVQPHCRRRGWPHRWRARRRHAPPRVHPSSSRASSRRSS